MKLSIQPLYVCLLYIFKDFFLILVLFFYTLIIYIYPLCQASSQFNKLKVIFTLKKFKLCNLEDTFNF